MSTVSCGNCELWYLSYGNCQLWQLWVMATVSCGRCELWQMWAVATVSCGKYELWQMWAVATVGCGKCELWQLCAVAIVSSSVHCNESAVWNKPELRSAVRSLSLHLSDMCVRILCAVRWTVCNWEIDWLTDWLTDQLHAVQSCLRSHQFLS
jgi:hypothetical protein